MRSSSISSRYKDDEPHGGWIESESYRFGNRECENAFIKTTYDISLDSQISLLPLGFSLYKSYLLISYLSSILESWMHRENPKPISCWFLFHEHFFQQLKEWECWKLLDWRLNSENDSRLHGQPFLLMSCNRGISPGKDCDFYLLFIGSFL